LSWSLHARYFFLAHDGHFRLMVGPVLGTDNHVLLVSDWDDAHEHWIGTTWLGPGVRGQRWLSPAFRMDLSAEVALVGLQSRSPSGQRPKQETFPDVTLPFRDSTRGAGLGSVFDWQVVRAAIELYATRARSTVPTGWGIGSEVMLSRASEPQLAFAFATTIRASYTWGL
jgi:hypothetical protein